MKPLIVLLCLLLFGACEQATEPILTSLEPSTTFEGCWLVRIQHPRGVLELKQSDTEYFTGTLDLDGIIAPVSGVFFSDAFVVSTKESLQVRFFQFSLKAGRNMLRADYWSYKYDQRYHYWYAVEHGPAFLVRTPSSRSHELASTSPHHR